KGSARSIPAFDLFSNCMKLRNLFTHFGGHAQAAGMSLPLENIVPLRDGLHDQITQQLTPEDFRQVIHISKTLAVSEISETLIDEMDKLAPFGMSNPKPVFHIKSVPADVRQLGNQKKHLKIQFQDDSAKLEGIGFSMGNLFDHISPKTHVSVVGELGINEWNGNKKVQIVMQDMQIDEWQLFDHRGKKRVDLSPYISNNDRRHMVLYEQIPDNLTVSIPENVKHITYDTDLNEIPVTDVLYLFDLPNDLN